ncbi:glycosyltransferase family 2 protein [Desulfatirhabdium butyrativorans]|uniref:glycosyltransferase family 2 protein n=1 Tax=Desulfatirhabdium butyrativorans TaxID=340467 RepID=UPI00054E750E|nr:glycosyltransferase [Desulfatirhabdium butyrativorans]
MPKVSVIIPTYNRNRFLRRAIESVLQQRYADFELIVVDDASSEPVQDIVRCFDDPRIRLIRHETNKGEAEARNTGILNASGEYIAFLDDDDEWLADKLALQVEKLETCPPKVGGIYTGYIVIDFSSGRELFTRIPFRKGDIYRDLLRRNVIAAPSTVLLRRVCFETAGLFDGSVYYGVDHDLFLRIAKHFHYDYLDVPLVKYHIHNGRMSDNPDIVVKGLNALSRRYARERGFLLNRTIMSDGYLDAGISYLAMNQRRKAGLMFLKSIRMNPFEWLSYYHLGISLIGDRHLHQLKRAKKRMLKRFSALP